MKKIIINGTDLTVEQVYPYRYDFGKGKEVLRVEILESNHNFDDVKVLANIYNQAIEYWEDEEKKNEYIGYCKDFSCNYQDGKYSIEISRISESDLKIAELERKLAENTEVINAMLLSDLEGGVANV
ncbi:hypothetical protein SAMN02746066_03421 [Anaerosporobacter mobilis DSM 15930]|jgi:hypothetical protein|uniref:Uncharacterized protein n=1 Tax=Anaerosporobacter mobilis DSM 15930 TaxID=1120996 RepID=A0A1M7LUP3_9FIRM|nr:hypothetical protein [Anaerosporobacter mobilis]SHM81996.1 hypothetical protein SAMN02746066_03421 [Anaerosporobacter mobilis DSM 15930]